MVFQLLNKNESLGIDFNKVKITEQMKKIREECEELAKEVYSNQRNRTKDNTERVTEECLDVIQANIGLLYILKFQGVDLESALRRHNEKLESRKWTFKYIIRIVVDKFVRGKEQ